MWEIPDMSLLRSLALIFRVSAINIQLLTEQEAFAPLLLRDKFYLSLFTYHCFYNSGDSA